VNVFCAVSIHTELLGPFCLAELTVTVVMYLIFVIPMCLYLDVFEEFIMTNLEKECPNKNYSILRVLQ